MIAVGIDVHKRLNSSSRLVTLGLLSLGWGLSQEFEGREVAQSLVRANGVVQPRALTPIKLRLEKCAIAGTHGRAGRSPCGASGYAMG
jgi:hypothetical protein